MTPKTGLIGVNVFPAPMELTKFESEYQTSEEPDADKGVKALPATIEIFPPVIGAVGLALMVKETATGKLFKLFTVCVT